MLAAKGAAIPPLPLFKVINAVTAETREDPNWFWRSMLPPFLYLVSPVQSQMPFAFTSQSSRSA